MYYILFKLGMISFITLLLFFNKIFLLNSFGQKIDSN